MLLLPLNYVTTEEFLELYRGDEEDCEVFVVCPWCNGEGDNHRNEDCDECDGLGGLSVYVSHDKAGELIEHRYATAMPDVYFKRKKRQIKMLSHSEKMNNEHWADDMIDAMRDRELEEKYGRNS